MKKKIRPTDPIFGHVSGKAYYVSSRETFANFISFSDFRHVLDLIKHRKKTKIYFLF